MAKYKENAKAKSSVTVRDPHYSEFDTQKKCNIQPDQRNKPSH